VYGVQWRSWPTPDGRHIDQISQLLDRLRTDPDSRRHIVSAWNVGELGNMALPPCHAFFQFYVADGRLSCQLYQRSADVFLGGRSMGGRMCSMAVAEGLPAAGLVLISGFLAASALGGYVAISILRSGRP